MALMENQFEIKIIIMEVLDMNFHMNMKKITMILWDIYVV
jgi:hypothetical protein